MAKGSQRVGHEHDHSQPNPEKTAPDSAKSQAATKPALSAVDLRDLESELHQREIALIEREIKSLRLQEELERLRPLSGLYRVVKSMATERKLDALLETITRETQNMLKWDRCRVFVLDQEKSELWTQMA